MTYYEYLIEKGVFLREALAPNPIEETDDGVWVSVLKANGAVRCRFVVDVADYEKLVLPYRWNAGTYGYNRIYTSAVGEEGNSTVLLARWLLNPPHDLEVDHINRNSLDNRRANLRVVDRKQNEENKFGATTRGVSSYRGVFMDSGRWRAQVTHNYKAYKSLVVVS